MQETVQGLPKQVSCDNDLYSVVLGIRLTHNRLIFTIPLDLRTVGYAVHIFLQR